MSSPADVAISALRTGSDHLAAQVRSLTPAQLTGPSGAADWTVAQVLSHLGSGAEIGRAALDASLNSSSAPLGDFNRSVWARWDAMSPEDQAAGFLTANESFVAYYEAIDDATRNTASVEMRRLPERIDLATHAGFRLNELTLHSWDVRVVQDPHATLAPEAVEPLLRLLPYLIGWLGKPSATLPVGNLLAAVHTSAPDTDFGLSITDTVTLIDRPTQPDATLDLPAESWLRLVSGRLGGAVTPSGVTVTGSLDLETLRAVFPGF